VIAASHLRRAEDRVLRSKARLKDDLAARDALIRAALAEGQTQADIARAVGVSRVWINTMAKAVARKQDALRDAGTSGGPTPSEVPGEVRKR
jgi:transposase